MSFEERNRGFPCKRAGALADRSADRRPDSRIFPASFPRFAGRKGSVHGHGKGMEAMLLIWFLLPFPAMGSLAGSKFSTEAETQDLYTDEDSLEDGFDISKYFKETASLAPLPGMLYPRESESREVKSLDGMWDFLVPPSEDIQRGLRESWHAQELSKAGLVMQMPVPSSYNDITVSGGLRDHVGAVWYERTFFVPSSWRDELVFIRFGSVNYLAQVWINGKLATNHEMGHLPFESEITSYLIFGGKNRITVAVDNTLLQTSVPQGKIVEMTTENKTVHVQTYAFDFFNYAGIHRPVLLHTKPTIYIEDITIKTGVISNMGFIKYVVEPAGLHENDVPVCKVILLDAEEALAIKEPVYGISGMLKVPTPRLWWPRSMDPNPGYLYTLEVRLWLPNVTKPDVYRLPIGIRTLAWNNTSLMINNRPIYFRGFGRHEDSALRGRGLDLVTVTRDHELLQWVGANSYRTSHYPYSDEVMDMADRQGFLIIDECPSVDTENFSPDLLARHKDSLSELIRRDKNRPSVIMWSLANEPRSQLRDAGDYFKQIAHHAKALDPTRPVTIAISQQVNDDKVGQYLDVISFNRYNAWYSNPGRLDMITKQVQDEAKAWHRKYNKPVLMSEYGADTMPGLHELPEYVWSEEYQTKLMSQHFKAFDELRFQGFFIGEFIWNFADFRTAQTYTRVAGNKKGVFTRDRQPKMAAHLVRKRYHALAVELDDAQAPNDLENYISPFYTHRSEI
ncbi:beta-glucuronidase isoform X2 [Orussus abietinus]|uniref:beta-glucuronidase isoform X2 n=1 Tax=Orussus abietinus TaxID=222816 RepID=UPI000626D42C|nr:beta-glucuronidase isoform X2 [Orussus abietinus]